MAAAACHRHQAHLRAFFPREKEHWMTKTFRKGEKVEWDSSGGHSEGKVIKKVTSATHIKGHKVAASKDNPEYIVESGKSGKRAAHKPEALTKA
jgi:hypothetical protein